MKTKRLIIISSLLILIIGSFFTSAEDPLPEINITEIMGLEDVDITGTGIEYKERDERVGGGASLTFTDENSALNINGNLFENIKTNEENLAYINLNEQGEITQADLTASEATSFFFEGIEYDVKKDSRVIYKDNKVKIYGKEGEYVEIKEKINEDFYTQPIKFSNFGGGEIEIENSLDGNKIISGNFETPGSRIKIKNLEEGSIARATFSNNGEVIKVWEGTDATINGIQHKTFKEDLNLYYSEKITSSLDKNQNYFVYGKDKIMLGGEGFTSILTEDNEIFPEFNKQDEGSLYYDYQNKEGKIEFSPQKGNLKIEKTSPDGAPLALNIEAEGGLEIKNGKWVLETDGQNLYSKIDPNSKEFSESDMRLNYLDNMQNKRTYDLDVESTFKYHLLEEDKEKIKEEMQELRSSKDTYSKEINKLLKKPKIASIRQQINDAHVKIASTDSNTNKLHNQLRLAYKEGDQIKIKEINEQIEKENEEINNLYTIIENLEKDSNYEGVYTRMGKISKMEREIEVKEFLLSQGEEFRTGALSQVISSEKEGAKITYAQYIQGFPVIKNTNVREYFDNKGRRLREPVIFARNLDILPFNVDSAYQTCADTQIELRAMYEFEQIKNGQADSIKFEIANGETLEYNSNGIYTVWDERNKKIIRKRENQIGEKFGSWVSNVQAYTNTGSLRNFLKQVNNLDDLKPGDIISLHPDPKTGYGHTKAIKEILEIPPGSGEIYYKLFAGSDPAIDARIYSTLTSQKELLQQITNNDAVLLTWGN